jgi:hypothetical protein
MTVFMMCIYFKYSLLPCIAAARTYAFAPIRGDGFLILSFYDAELTQTLMDGSLPHYFLF